VLRMEMPAGHGWPGAGFGGAPASGGWRSRSIMLVGGRRRRSRPPAVEKTAEELVVAGYACVLWRSARAGHTVKLGRRVSPGRGADDGGLQAAAVVGCSGGG
jgi:hypothetical protein